MEKTYTVETLKQICGGEKLKEVFETHKSRDDGLWVRKLPQRDRRLLTRAEQAIFECHPRGNLDIPALPYPFTARQLAAFSLAGGGSAIREICVTRVSTSPDDGIPDELTALNEECLAELGDNADDAREALREVHRLYAECVAKFGSTDKGLRDGANWLLAQAPASIQKKERGIGSGKKWTGERLESLRTYREKYGTTKAAEWAGISPSRLRALLPRDEPPPKGYSAFTHRTK